MRAALAGALLWIGAVLGAMPLSARAERITIATYNIENYTAANRMTADGYRKDYPKPEVEKAALRRVIHDLAADVLVLQEVGPKPYLDELQRDLKSEGAEYPFVAMVDAADADRHIAVLARRPLGAVTPHADLTFLYFGKREPVKRGMIEVRLPTGAGELTLFAVHLKSRYTDRKDDPDSAQRRAGEATAIRDRILARFSDPAKARFLILGDCNDTKRSATVRRLLQRGDTTIAVLLPAADSRGEAWTHVYGREDIYSRFDQILASPGLAGAVEGGAARIYDGPGVREASDHRPVVVTLSWAE